MYSAFSVVRDGQATTIGRRQLDGLRMLADWQLRQQGYDPASITTACRIADDGEQHEDYSLSRYPLKA